MGHQYRVDKIYDASIETETTTATSWYSVAGCDRVGFFIVMTETGTADTTISLEGTFDDSTAVTLEFQDGGGLGTTEQYTASADDVIWLPAGCPAPSKIRASILTNTASSGNSFATEIWLVADRT